MAVYELLTATRFDPLLSTLDWNDDPSGPCPFLFLKDHLHRLIAAANQHDWHRATDSLTYDILKSTCQKAVPGGNDAQKIRITLSVSGHLQASATPVKPLTVDPTLIPSFDPEAGPTADLVALYLDPQPTPTSLYTITKTTERTVYNDARIRVALPPTPADVLMYNMQGLVTETSIFNVAFYRSSCWLTPAASTGCLPGILRQRLLQWGRIREDSDHTLTRDSIRPGDWVLLFNSVQGCRFGRIVE